MLLPLFSFGHKALFIEAFWAGRGSAAALALSAVAAQRSIRVSKAGALTADFAHR
jgi:hypothetical protein